MGSYLVLGKFAMDAEVLYIGNRDIISGLSYWTENGFSVDTQDRCLRNVSNGQVILSFVRWSLGVLFMEEEPLGDAEILLIIDARERYLCCTKCFSAEQVARLPEYKSRDHLIPLQDTNAKIPTGAIYKTTWEEEEGLRKFLSKNIPIGKF